jgi:hypothetical protein
MAQRREIHHLKDNETTLAMSLRRVALLPPGSWPAAGLPAAAFTRPSHPPAPFPTRSVGVGSRTPTGCQRYFTPTAERQLTSLALAAFADSPEALGVAEVEVVVVLGI